MRERESVWSSAVVVATLIGIACIVLAFWGNHLAAEQVRYAKLSYELAAQSVANAQPNSDKQETNVSNWPLILSTVSPLVGVVFFGFVLLRIARPKGDPNKLIIHYARYGIGTHRGEYRDVAEILRGYIKNGNSIDVNVGHVIFGDPFPGQSKYTHLKYSLGGVTRVLSLQEMQKLTLSKADTDLDLQIAKKREWHAKAEALQSEVDSMKQELANRGTSLNLASVLPQIHLVYAKPDPLAPEADYPSKVRCELQNTSTESAKVRVAEWIPGISGLHAKLPGRTLQLRIAGDWWPKPDGADEVHVPPLEFFHLWIAPSGHSTIDELQRWLTAGQLGTLALIVNETRVEVRL